MKVVPLDLAGVLLIEPPVFRDARGFFLETYHASRYAEYGLTLPFVQDNHSYSIQKTLRGLHTQVRKPQGKLIRVLEGEIFDVAVDLRQNSKTFGQHLGVTLASESFCQLYLPPGFAHGFCVLSPVAHVEYKCTELYDPPDECTLLWSDPELAIPWPIRDPLLSEKDRRGLSLQTLMQRLAQGL